MNENLIKEFNNVDLLKEICEAYDYTVEIIDGKVLCIIDGADKADEENFTYNSIEDALIDWLDTLIESEMCYIKEKVNISWICEIEYIKELKANLLFDESSTTLNESLTYGKIPSNLNKKLSVYIDKQSDLADEYIKEYESDIKLKRATLPVEFVLVNNELEYVKIANKDFIKRLIFDADTSEIDFSEQDVYTREGLVDFMPLLPIDEVNKFEINIPVAIMVLHNNNDIKIKTPIKYLELF